VSDAAAAKLWIFGDGGVCGNQEEDGAGWGGAVELNTNLWCNATSLGPVGAVGGGQWWSLATGWEGSGCRSVGDGPLEAPPPRPHHPRIWRWSMEARPGTQGNMPFWETDHTAKPTGDECFAGEDPAGAQKCPPDAARLFEIP
jgi:hypothetical protein